MGIGACLSFVKRGKEPSYAQNPGGFFNLKKFFLCASLNPMAKFMEYKPAEVSIKQGETVVTYNAHHIDMTHHSGGRVYLHADLFGARMTTKINDMPYPPFPTKEATVSNKYDVNTEKNTAIDTLVMGVQQLERALFQEKQQIDRVSREQAALVESASAALNHQLAESIHAGVTRDDLRTHFPSTFVALQARMQELQSTMSVDNAPALV